MEEIEPSSILAGIIHDAKDRKRARAGMEAMRTRTEFRSNLEQAFAGIAMVPAARERADEAMNAVWGQNRLDQVLNYGNRELVIGSGPHAAAYCAARSRAGFPKPYVAEMASPEGIGGAFTAGPFWLNSRNRPGEIGLPDQDMALNDIPGGVVQPSMISAGEYSSSGDMAFCIRATLAQYAYVIPLAEVTGLEVESTISSTIRVSFASGISTVFGRVIDARGMGAPRAALSAGGAVITFGEFMTRMREEAFPLRGLKSVAVIGGGDSGACAAEACLGLAPAEHYSAIGLDYVRRVDWFTGGSFAGNTCDGIRSMARGRYMRLGQYASGNVSNPSDRLGVYSASGFAGSFAGRAMVNSRTYDLAVQCTGYQLPVLGRDGINSSIGVGDMVLARKVTAAGEWFRVGPAAGITFTLAENAAGLTPASQVAMFRLIPRTAALAGMLPGL